MYSFGAWVPGCYTEVAVTEGNNYLRPSLNFDASGAYFNHETRVDTEQSTCSSPHAYSGEWGSGLGVQYLSMLLY